MLITYDNIGQHKMELKYNGCFFFLFKKTFCKGNYTKRFYQTLIAKKVFKTFNSSLHLNLFQEYRFSELSRCCLLGDRQLDDSVH